MILAYLKKRACIHPDALDSADWLMNSTLVDLFAEVYRKPDPATRREEKIADSARAIQGVRVGSAA